MFKTYLPPAGFSISSCSPPNTCSWHRTRAPLSFCCTSSPKISSISKFLIQGRTFSWLHVNYSLSEKLRKGYLKNQRTGLMEFGGPFVFHQIKIVAIIFQPAGFRVSNAVSQLLFSYTPSKHQGECHKQIWFTLFSLVNNLMLYRISIPDFLQDS